MIDQCQNAGLVRAFSHSSRFVSIHGHRLFAEYGFAAFQCSERHLAMRDDWRDDAHQIDILASNQRAPVAFDVFNAKFVRDFLGMLAVRAGDCDHARAFTVLEARNLCRARKARANNAYADCLCDDLAPITFRSLLITFCLLLYGAPAGIRTPNQQIMSLLL